MKDQTYRVRRIYYRGLITLGLLYLLVLAGGSACVHVYRIIGPAIWWTVKVGTVMGCQMLIILLGKKRILSGQNLDYLWGTANILTQIRGALVAILAGFLFVPKQPGFLGWLPALLYTVLAALDFLDGYWARKSGTETRMGELLDQEYDALGILVAVILAIQYKHLSSVFIYIGIAKYLFAWGIVRRRHRGRPVCDLPPSFMRRRLAGFQMGILAVILWPIASPIGSNLAESIIGIPLAVGFIRDWLIVSDRLNPENPVYVRLKKLFYTFGKTWLPLVIRGSLLAAAGWILYRTIVEPDSVLAWLPDGLQHSRGLFVLYPAVRLLLTLILAAGRLTSVGSLQLLLLEVLRVFLSRFDFFSIIILTSALLLYLLGSGPYRLTLSELKLSRNPARKVSSPR